MLLPLGDHSCPVARSGWFCKGFCSLPCLQSEDVEGKAWTPTSTADYSSTTSTALVVAVLVVVAVAAIPLTAT
jgi:hypothetical protein